MGCPNLSGCPFYNNKMPGDSALAKLYKKNYCESEYTKCARYRVSTELGKEHVPLDLYPNMFDRAEEIISKYKK